MLPTDLSPGTIVVFRASHRKQCEERAFMLAAVGISSELAFDGLDYVVRVAQDDAPRTVGHLTQYEAERRPKPPPPPPPPTLPNAWVGCVIYVMTLVAIGLLISNGFWRLDAFDR
ncbi:MAG TPA: hypothetical protein VNZ06_02690, partial [Steroidobacteraceae bacterium]|nr:hypothetical protein [Steroidobacteraceae bacterium]